MRWLSRFTLRTTLGCLAVLFLYYACWGPTKTRGVVDVWVHVNLNATGWPWSTNFDLATTPELPLVVSMLSAEPLVPENKDRQIERRYYFWFFGFVARLPVTHQIRFERFDPPVSLPGGFELVHQDRTGVVL